MIHNQSISAIRIFGSKARGDADELSDVDLLVVQRKRICDNDKRLTELWLSIFGERRSICWYSESALRRMFREGHLFAWHLYRESKRIRPSESDFIDSLGKPARYRMASADIAGFRHIVAGATESLAACSANASYEAGVLFVCSRNIAMIASTYAADGPYFGRRSPFQLERAARIQFPLTIKEHDENMKARAFAHRGFPVLRNAQAVSVMANLIARWSDIIHKYVTEHENEDEHTKQPVRRTSPLGTQGNYVDQQDIL
jgi:Polymerase beta, Nucleotidyltransferase